MKLLVDMNLSPDGVPLLASYGWEARHWSTVGPGNAPDTELMRWAREHLHVIVTQDLDFSQLLFATRDAGPSVVRCSPFPAIASGFVTFPFRPPSSLSAMKRIRRLGEFRVLGSWCLVLGFFLFARNLFAGNDFTLFCVSDPGGCLLKSPPANEAARG